MKMKMFHLQLTRGFNCIKMGVQFLCAWKCLHFAQSTPHSWGPWRASFVESLLSCLQ